MEKLLLGAVFTYYKLNIIDQEYVDGPVFVSELFLFVVMDRIDDFIGEIVQLQRRHDMGSVRQVIDLDVGQMGY